MTKVQAICELINDSRNKRCSTASAKRVLKACKALDLTADEMRHVFQMLSYADDSGEPYSKFIERVWP